MLYIEHTSFLSALVEFISNTAALFKMSFCVFKESEYLWCCRYRSITFFSRYPLQANLLSSHRNLVHRVETVALGDQPCDRGENVTLFLFNDCLEVSTLIFLCIFILIIYFPLFLFCSDLKSHLLLYLCSRELVLLRELAA